MEILIGWESIECRLALCSELSLAVDLCLLLQSQYNYFCAFLFMIVADSKEVFCFEMAKIPEQPSIDGLSSEESQCFVGMSYASYLA